ncbi:TetR/AcrR family transcriptional regulator [Pseudonocardia sp. DLS-67]
MDTSPTDRPPEDLTARARIRDAALLLFAEHGPAGTTIRGVADAAGVSTGSVQHHFGSKAGLRQACDDHAIGTLLAHAKNAMSGTALPAGQRPGQLPAFPSTMFADSERSTRYLARALVDGSPAAAALFDAGAELAETWLSAIWPERRPEPSERVRDAAAVMAAMHLGTVVLHEHLSRRMGTDVLDRQQAHRIGAGIADLYAAMARFLDSPDEPVAGAEDRDDA